ncbi:GTPase family protein [Thorsellia anophelis]|uniref:G domain-containing protein n=1 Tax=Thorsellia anophelis DSM 18579 TaxID=1123402 RepID=A0A1I0CVY4_9GAMM|nr:GTP-binding protein [Thorsellia anophelis]SET24001.1 hypothetical protein SAMN02583745_01772 [Thorsellia anophelis DSM 18579]
MKFKLNDSKDELPFKQEGEDMKDEVSSKSSGDSFFDKLFEELMNKRENSTNAGIWKILEEVKSTFSYTPKIGIVGDSGIGKSSLCNALFGREVFPTSGGGQGCTREAQTKLIQTDKGKFEITDLPGIGESPEWHDEYVDLYKKHIPEFDILIWAIKADSRAWKQAIDAYKELTCELKSCPIVFALTQSDKVNPSSKFCFEKMQPNEKQIININSVKERVVAEFDVALEDVISVAIVLDEETGDYKNYNLSSLVTRIVEVLPNKKKKSFTREAADENITEETQKKADKGFWDHIKEFAGDIWEEAEPYVKPLLGALSGKIISQALSKFKFW